jgi:predicted small secreted protein
MSSRIERSTGMRIRAITWLLALSFGLGGLVLAGCNTTEGFGKDVKNLGSSIENKAAEKK